MKSREPHTARINAESLSMAEYWRSARTPRRTEHGVALVLVLAFIALCTVLVVAFFASVSTEAVSENATSSENSAAQLATSAVQLVEGTISYATEPKIDTTFAWACQPGMIRTYGTNGGPTATSQGMASASPLAYYKLYSSDNMILSGEPACDGFTTLNNDVPQYWDYAPSLYADLNAPLIKQVSTGGATPTTTTIFPIVDPRAGDLSVGGFSYVRNLDAPMSSRVVDGITSYAGGVTNYSKDSGTRLAMPVRWMYVLKDGTMTVPDGTNVPASKTPVTSAAWSGANATLTPTAANPIVGRIAFWTDDESAKVNVNTASEGTYWDTIVANSGASPFGNQPIPTSSSVANPIPDYTLPMGDVPMALLPPAQHEYQRYPGHPATTCLSVVLGNALTYGASSRASFVKAFTDATPRVTDLATATSSSGTSSMGGTQVPQAGGGSSTVNLATDLDRLYTSLDEFQFTPQFLPQHNPPRVVQALGSSNSITLQDDVDTCRFFLTAHSKAPELNLFGLPRVAVWPIWSTPGKRTPYEQEMARCATVDNVGDPHQMIFQRATALDPSFDWTGIPRNQQVYGYLQALTNRAVPGFGGQFSLQYGQPNTDQILTEIFDYIRCINLADNSAYTGPSGVITATPYTGTVSNGKIGEVLPITITAPPNGDGSTTHGLGRIATIGELALVLIKVDDRVDTTKAEAGNIATSVSVTGGPVAQFDPSKKTLVEWALVPKLVSPMSGYVALANNIRFKFSQINLSIGGYTTSGPYPDMYETGRCSTGRDSVIGGLMGIEALTENSANASAYPTGLLLLDGTSGSQINISGTVTVQIYAPDPGASPTTTPLQTLQFNFAMPGSSSTPVPAPIPALALNSSTSSATPPVTTYTWYGTMRAAPGTYTTTNGASFAYPSSNVTKNGQRVGASAPAIVVGSSTDVVRSLVPMGTTPNLQGDLRLLALAQNPPAGAATPLPPTAFTLDLVGSNSAPGGTQDPLGAVPGVPPTAATYAADTLRAFTIVREAGYGWGSLSASVSPAKYDVITAPEIPPQPVTNGVSPGVPTPGDWDNGVGLMPDGPWANKPDEGVVGQPDRTGIDIPYIGSYTSMTVSTQQAQTLFSPSRQISSPVMFGSLPAGNQPWRTLLFRPAKLTSTTAHPGGAKETIRDHLLLDLFWMPVVEPYGISEPFATSGKINLNSQIMPFTYITRTTGLRAVLKSVMLTAINPSANGDTFANSYKHSYPGATNDVSGKQNSDVTRYPIEPEGTIGQFTVSGLSFTSPADNVNAYPEFGRGTHTALAPNFFVSASQICDLPLVPQGSSATGLSSFWAANCLTGDNSLERPYSLIYPRVTTKSNIFTVHVLAQSLKQIPADATQHTWYENKDQILSEYRGAYTIEKYFDPNTDDLTSDAAGIVPCLATQDGNISPTAGLRATKWRLLGVKRFGQ